MLANVVGVSNQAVSKWESGGSPDIELLPAIADYFDVSLDALFGRKAHNIGKDIEDKVAERIRSFNTIEERLEKVFSLLWLLELAIFGRKATDNERNIDDFLNINKSYVDG